MKIYHCINKKEKVYRKYYDTYGTMTKKFEEKDEAVFKIENQNAVDIAKNTSIISGYVIVSINDLSGLKDAKAIKLIRKYHSPPLENGTLL